MRSRLLRVFEVGRKAGVRAQISWQEERMRPCGPQKFRRSEGRRGIGMGGLLLLR